MCIELKIKAKHLALEPAIIRFEERKLHKAIRLGYTENNYTLNSLIYHRKVDVKNEARATQLAIAYIKGKAYNKVELKRRADKERQFKDLVLPKVLAMLKKYGKTREQRITTMETLLEWSKI